jgi:purine-nucleoside phosphorylase
MKARSGGPGLSTLRGMAGWWREGVFRGRWQRGACVTREPDGVTDEVAAAAAALRRAAPVPPLTAVILGSGLAGVGGMVSDAVTMSVHEIPHWPLPGVAGHSGVCVLGRVGARPVVVVAGRVHLYEGMGIGAVTFAVRVLARLGVRELILTNAAGGIAHGLVPGTLMAIDDHIGLLVPNPLVGPNDDRLGPRFPDMTATYSPRLRALADTVAREAGLALAHGVYVAVTGPSYETPADVRALRALGADAVGASTVPEAIVARHLGLEVLGLSVIANRAAGLGEGPLSHEEVLHHVQGAHDRLAMLLGGIMARM